MSRFRGVQAERTLEGFRAFFADAPRGTEAERGSRADARVLELFRSVAREVPAYQRFLAQHAVDPAQIRDIVAFRTLPATTKDNYYRPHPLPELCRHGVLDACDMVALSSGSTGEPAVWPRFISDELGTARRFEQVLGEGFEAASRRTLCVICFNWVGGLYTLACCRQLAAKGYPLTVVAPGNNPGEILRAVRALGAHYEQRILCGYPPFLKDVVELGCAQGIDWSAPPTRLVLAGEVFSEEWRSAVCGRLEPDTSGFDPELPFVYVFGRSHFAVSFYGANVYPENVSVGTEGPEFAASLTGKFVLEVLHDNAEGAELALRVELQRDETGTPDLRGRIERAVRAQLERLNSEFLNYVPEHRRTPRVTLGVFGDPEYFPSGVKHRYTRSGAT